MTVSNIINDIRDFVADPNADRWTDNRLIYLINRAQYDIASKGHGIRGKFTFGATTGKYLYELPDDLLMLTRVTVNDYAVPLKSHEEMDRIDDNWEATTGSDVTHIIYDKLSEGFIRVYPEPTDAYTSLYTTTDDYGLSTTLGTDDYGIIVNPTVNDGSLIIDEYGTIIQIVSSEMVVVCYYIKRPNDITDINEHIALDSIWSAAITHYVCGHLLRGDKDTLSRQLGTEELQLYKIELEENKHISSKDFTRSTQYETEYRRL